MAVITHAEVEVLLINETIADLKKVGLDATAFNPIHDGFEGINYYFKKIKSVSIIDGIASEVKKTKANLLIMVPEQHGFWDSLVHRSKTRIMAAGLNIPLYSLPA